MQARHASVLLAVAACLPRDLAEFPPACDPAVETCPPGAGATTTGTTTGDEGDGTGGIQTVTSATSTTSTSTATSSPSDTSGDSEPAPAPAIVSMHLTPNPLTSAGPIDVAVLAGGADSVRLEVPGAAVQLTEGPKGEFHGTFEVYTGLTNGTYEATVTPSRGDLEGEAVSQLYTLDLPAAGELFLWDTMPDHGLGEVTALGVTSGGHVVGLGTLHENGVPRCFLHRRDLEGKYGEADDIRVLFADKECQAIDLVVDGETLYLLVSMVGGDGPRWRVGRAEWGAEPTILRTGAKDEKAYAMARSPSGKTVICGTAPSFGMMEDQIDGRVWPLYGAAVELDYVVNPEEIDADKHRFDETLRDCAFAEEHLVAVGDVLGRHETTGLPLPPERMRPLLLEFDDNGAPTWHVAGLGPGNTTQGSISALALDDEGRYVTGLYTCGDICDPQGEVRVYEPGGNLWWQLTLGAGILPPEDIAWSPGGYLVVASAEVTGNWSSKFLLQAFVPKPGQYEPVWSFSKADVPSLHLARSVVVGPGVVVAGGVGGTAVPALAFLHP